MSLAFYPKNRPVSIASGQSVSNSIDLDSDKLVAVVTPSAWTAAALTIQCSVDNGVTWTNVYDATGAEISIPVAANGCYQIPPANVAGLALIRLRSGTSATPVNQAAARTITLVTLQVG